MIQLGGLEYLYWSFDNPFYEVNWNSWYWHETVYSYPNPLPDTIWLFRDFLRWNFHKPHGLAHQLHELIIPLFRNSISIRPTTRYVFDMLINIPWCSKYYALFLSFFPFTTLMYKYLTHSPAEKLNRLLKNLG